MSKPGPQRRYKSAATLYAKIQEYMRLHDIDRPTVDIYQDAHKGYRVVRVRKPPTWGGLVHHLGLSMQGIAPYVRGQYDDGAPLTLSLSVPDIEGDIEGIDPAYVKGHHDGYEIGYDTGYKAAERLYSNRVDNSQLGSTVESDGGDDDTITYTISDILMRAHEACDEHLFAGGAVGIYDPRIVAEYLGYKNRYAEQAREEPEDEVRPKTYAELEAEREQIQTSIRQLMLEQGISANEYS